MILSRIGVFLAFVAWANCASVTRFIGGNDEAIKSGLEDAIMEQMVVLQEWMLEGNPEMGLPVLDPYQAEHYEYATSNEDITINLALDGIRASGLASFQLADIDISISKLRVEALLQIPQIAASADHYFLDGVVASILPIFGDGAADLTIDNINITFAASLTTLNDQVGLKNVTVGAAFESIHGQIENFLGGDMDDVINDIINILGAEIFNSISALIAEDVAMTLQDYVNAQLEGLSLQDLLDLLEGTTTAPPELSTVTPSAFDERQGNANEYLDALLENVREYLVTNGFDNYTLPDRVEGFSEEWIGITWHGEAKLFDGWLTGLQTIHRAGDAALSVDGETGTISLEGLIEFFDFAAGYNMYVGFMDLGIDARAEVKISSVQIELKVRLIVTDPTDVKGFIVEIDELNITNPGLVTVEFHGLGPLNFLLDALGFLVGNIFGGLIFNAVEGPIASAITNALLDIIPSQYIQY
jgi:hypothetical protein